MKIEPNLGHWIIYQLRLQGKSQQDIRRVAKVSNSMVPDFLRSRKSSANIERATAQVLGYESFEALRKQWLKECV